MRSMRRNTPSSGQVGAAPLVVGWKSAIPPLALQATPGGENLRWYHDTIIVQPNAGMSPQTPFGDGSTRAWMHIRMGS